MSLNEIGSMVAMQGFSGLSLFTVLLLMALGLAIIFGQMGVINMAHGEFMAIGAYVVYLFSQLTQNFAPGLREVYFVPAVVAAFFVAAAVG
jgi:urea transport system permease protein